MKKYFITYGCYIDTCYDVVEAQSLAFAAKEAYYEAKEVCITWIGSHGFGDPDEEDFDEQAFIEDNADYKAELYVPELHDDYLT